MKNKQVIFVILSASILSACSFGQKSTAPMVPLSKITMSPERNQAFLATLSAWNNGKGTSSVITQDVSSIDNSSNLYPTESAPFDYQASSESLNNQSNPAGGQNPVSGGLLSTQNVNSNIWQPTPPANVNPNSQYYQNQNVNQNSNEINIGNNQPVEDDNPFHDNTENTNQTSNVQKNSSAGNSNGFFSIGNGASSDQSIQQNGTLDNAVPNVNSDQYVYQLQNGENALCIARRFNVDWNDLVNLNPDITKSSAGSYLVIPKKSVWNEGNGSRMKTEHPAEYDVHNGDTLNSIACIFGDITPEKIAEANSLDVSSVLSSGMKLQIP